MKKKSPWSRIALLAVCEALLLWGLWRGMVYETAAANQAVNDISDLKDPSPFRAALMGHLGKIHLSLQGYLNSPDPSLLKQMADSRKDFESSLPEFARQNPHLFPTAASDEIHRTFGVFKDAVDRTLEANTHRMQGRDALEQNFTRILFLLDHNIRPLIRKDQPDGDERGEAILNIENQLRAWQQHLTQAWAQPSDAAKAIAFDNDSRGDIYIERYERLELLPRERKVEREILSLWKSNSDLSRDSFAMESVVSLAVASMDADRQQVSATLNQYLPVMPPAQLEIRKQAILWTIRFHTAGACALGFVGLVSLVFVVLGIYRLASHHVAGEAKGSTGNTSSGRQAPLAFEPTFQMDLKGTIMAWSSSAETLYGYSASEMRGLSIGKLFESESEINRLYRELQSAHQAFFETTHKTKAGKSIPVRIEFRPVTDGSGRAPAIGVICTRL